MNKRPLIVVTAAVGALAAAIAVVKLLECPVVRRRFGLDALPATADDIYVDEALDESFPASDPTSFSPRTSAPSSQ